MTQTATPAPPVKQIIEAALLAAGQPLAVAQLAALFPEDQPPPAGAIERALHELAEDCEQRGVALVEVASGFRFQVREQYSPWVSQLWTERQTRYSRALLETLALIAYRQPITRGEIEQIRGVAVSSNIIRTLEERDWVRVVGHRDVPGKPALYGTTRGFLDYFGLKSLDQLPPLSELREIPELEPQFPFDNPDGGQSPQPRDGAAMVASIDDGTGAEPQAGVDDSDTESGKEVEAEAPVDADIDAEVESRVEAGSDVDPDGESDADAGTQTTPDVAALADAASTASTGNEADTAPDPAAADTDDGSASGLQEPTR